MLETSSPGQKKVVQRLADDLAGPESPATFGVLSSTCVSYFVFFGLSRITHCAENHGVGSSVGPFVSEVRAARASWESVRS